MTTLAALQSLIAQGESETLELKRSTAELKRAGETLCGTDADQHLATLAVQERAERLAGALQLGGRALELERLGLALGDERLEGGEGGHGVPH